MENNLSKAYWDDIYDRKQPGETSWHQAEKTVSLPIVESLQLDNSAGILDIGCGDSQLLYELFQQGYQNLHGLDISTKAIQKAQNRMGESAKEVDWIVSDVRDFNPDFQVGLWHDRAALHFLTELSDVQKYVSIAAKTVVAGGFLVVGAFHTDGPTKCSGLPIQQYDENRFAENFGGAFSLIETRYFIHNTPFDTKQSFIFAVLKRN